MGDALLCSAGQELRRNIRAVHEQHSQLFRALAQFSSSGNAVSDSSAAPARAYPPPAPILGRPPYPIVGEECYEPRAAVWPARFARASETNSQVAQAKPCYRINLVVGRAL